MNGLRKSAFNPIEFLSRAGVGRKIIQLRKGEALFSQGDKADCVFYIQKGRAKLTVVSKSGREATISLLLAGDFAGEESVAAVAGLRFQPQQDRPVEPDQQVRARQVVLPGGGMAATER